MFTQWPPTNTTGFNTTIATTIIIINLTTTYNTIDTTTTNTTYHTNTIVIYVTDATTYVLFRISVEDILYVLYVITTEATIWY